MLPYIQRKPPAKREMRRKGYEETAISYASSFVPLEDPELIEARKEYNRLLQQFKAERAEEQQKVIDLGGLHIIGTERHESRRIDNQLRGRAGRQGDPGSSQFFISLEDELMRLFGGERIQGLVERLGVGEDEPIEANMLTKSIENAQKKVEGRNFSIRKYVLQYDNVMNKQREIIYEERRRVLYGEDLRNHIMSMVEELVDENIDFTTAGSKFAEEWDLGELENSLRKICVALESFNYTEDDIAKLDKTRLKEDTMELFEKAYQAKEEEIGMERMRELERMILIRVVDNKWMDHIDAMDQLKHGIGLRALGQQDPAAAYAAEGFDMFDLMIKTIKEDTVKFCFNVTVQTDTKRKQILGTGEGRKEDFNDGEPSSASNQDSSSHIPKATQVPERERKQEPVRKGVTVGRNEPCPCGSGRKYKKCCGKNTEE
jgi:preprotein translocase subunit SecA